VTLIKDIKNRFNTLEAFSAFSDCMYMPTWEKFNKCALEFIDSASTSIFGYLDDNHIVAIIVIDKQQNKMSEIRGISIHPAYRNRGIGRQLVQYACNLLAIKNLYAETDDDAVDFYKHCGFQTKVFYKEDEKGSYRRHECVLRLI